MGNETSQNTSYGDSIDNDIVIRSKKVSSEFPAREGQICCVSGTKVYAFGGVSQHGEELRESNDLTVFETGISCMLTVLRFVNVIHCH